jgi:hypothetical protein
MLRAWCLLALLLCATATLLALPHKTEAVSKLGLVGYWTFDENTGTTAEDFSGRGNYATTNSNSHSPTPPT